MRGSALLYVGLLLAACSYDASRLHAPNRSDAADLAVVLVPDGLAMADVLGPEPVVTSPEVREAPEVAGDDAVELAGDDAPADGAVDVPPIDDAGESEVGGGTGGAGGATGTGGTFVAAGSGGSVATGGTGAGGATGTGGTSAPDAGPDASPDSAPGTVVTFVGGKAQGAMWGYGFVNLGIKDTLTSPTWGGTLITGLTPSHPALSFMLPYPAAEMTWSTSDALCMTGSVPGLSPAPTDQEYENNWGVMLGFYTRDPVQGMGVSYRNIKFTVTGSPLTGLRAVVHLNPDKPNTTYCAKITPGTPTNFTAFNTNCWDNTGTYLLASDVVKIDAVALHVPSVDGATAVRNLCLTRIDLAR